MLAMWVVIKRDKHENPAMCLSRLVTAVRKIEQKRFWLKLESK